MTDRILNTISPLGLLSPRACLVVAIMVSVVTVATVGGATPARAGCEVPQRWEDYVNPHFGTRIEVPLDCFSPLPPPENQDGRAFLSADGAARLSVYGWQNSENHTPASLKGWLKETVGGYDRVSYAPLGRNWLVLSGYRGEDIYYEKYVFSGDKALLHAFWLTFPRARKPVFAPIVERMEDSFRGGAG